MGDTQEDLVFRQILQRHAEETITDEQVKRLLAPVKNMINAGYFDKPKRRNFSWLLTPLAAATTVVVLITIMAISQT